MSEAIDWLRTSPLTGVFLKLPAGALSDLFGRRRLLVAGALVFASVPFTFRCVGAWRTTGTTGVPPSGGGCHSAGSTLAYGRKRALAGSTRSRSGLRAKMPSQYRSNRSMARRLARSLAGV